MKSSTVRRSALSKESMNVLENLANEDENNSYNQQPDYKKTEDTSYDSYGNVDDIPSEYVRPREKYDRTQNSKSKEIDLLWQSFKSAQLNSNSSFIHILSGFVAGVLSTIIILALSGFFTINPEEQRVVNNTMPAVEESGETSLILEESKTKDDESIKKITEEFSKPKKVKEVKETKPVEHTAETTTTQEESVVPVKTKKYVIKSGDTVEAIIRHEYGAYTKERADAVMKANNLSNLDHISIDQVLLLPLEN